MLRALTLTLALAAHAHAQVAPETLAVGVGQSLVRDVGGALGYQCDDPSLITAEVKTMTFEGRPATNVFSVTGLKPGKTLCRVGLDYSRRTVVFEVRVSAIVRR